MLSEKTKTYILVGIATLLILSIGYSYITSVFCNDIILEGLSSPTPQPKPMPNPASSPPKDLGG